MCEVLSNLMLGELFVERAAVVSKQGVGLDVLSVRPGAAVGLVAVLVVHFHLQHKQSLSPPLKCSPTARWVVRSTSHNSVDFSLNSPQSCT